MLVRVDLGEKVLGIMVWVTEGEVEWGFAEL